MPDMHDFALDSLAARCRDSAPGQWPQLCNRQIMDWVEGEPQRAWLRRSSFDDVRDLLDVWLTGAPETAFEGDPDGPDQPFSAQVPTGCTPA
jgi:hypothetical protein